jgi:hypothetical protein
MTTLKQPTQEEQKEKEKNPFSQLFRDDQKLTIVRPKTPMKTIFRPIPEFSADGAVRPMVNMVTPGGLDFSNIILKETAVLVGILRRITMFNQAIDTPNNTPVNSVWSGLYIRLKNRIKNQKVPTDLIQKVYGLFPQDKTKSSQLARPKNFGFMQGIFTQVNDVKLEKPRARCVLVMPASLVTAMDRCLTEAYKNGLDVFSPDKGRFLEIGVIPKGTNPGQQTDLFDVVLGAEQPIGADKMRKFWTPWESCLDEKTYADHIRLAVEVFGRDVVEFVFPDEVAAHCGRASAAAQTQTRQQTVQTPPVQQTQSRPAPTPAAPAQDLNSMQIDTESEIPGGFDADDEDDAPAPVATPPSTAPAAAAPAPTVSKPKSKEEIAADLEKLLG